MEEYDEDYIGDNDGPKYRPASEIQSYELVKACCSLKFFGDDAFLRMQAQNLALIDKFITDLEEQNLHQWMIQERTPIETFFLSAQTQMWIFGLYEVFRTWRSKVRDLITLSQSNGLNKRLDLFEGLSNTVHLTQKIRQKHIEEMLQDETIEKQLEDDLLRTEIFFIRLEEVRIPLAKHEVRNSQKKKLSEATKFAYMPGYSRINRYCGSLEYEMSTGDIILDYITRRDIADELRSLVNLEVPLKEDIASFKKFMMGLTSEEMEEIRNQMNSKPDA